MNEQEFKKLDIHLEVSLHNDRDSSFRNTRMQPQLKRIGLKRTKGGSKGVFFGSADAQDFADQFKRILNELIDPDKRTDPGKRSAKYVDRASLNTISLKIGKNGAEL